MNRYAKIVTIGMASCDTYYEMESLPVKDGKYCAQMLGCYCGGMATNVAINLNVLGYEVILVHSLGKDLNGKFIEKKLELNFTKDQLLTSRASHSFASQIFIDQQTSKRHAILTNGEYPEKLTSHQLVAISQADFIYYDGSWPIDGHLLRANATNRDVKIMVNLEFPNEHLSNWNEWADFGIHSSSYLKLSENCTKSEIEIALRNYLQPTVKLVGMTCGHKGGLFVSHNSTLNVNSFCVNVVDSNGAGDAFQAGLIHGLVAGLKYDHCLQLAAAIAAVKCMIVGPNLSGLNKEQVMKKVENISGIKYW